jgi:hypothetical protein
MMGAGYVATGDAFLAVRVLVAEHQAVIAMDLVQMLGTFGCIALGPVWPCEAVVAASRLHPDAVVLGLDVLEDLAFPTVRDLAERGIPAGLFSAGAEAFVRAGFWGWGIVAAGAPLTGLPPRAGAAMVPFAGLLTALEGIPDPRRRQGRRYPLAPLLLFSVLAVLAGAASYRGILIFIGVHRERLNATFGTRLRRAPAVNTLRDLLHALDPAEIEAAFRRHAEHLGNATTAPGRRVIALDGKTLRGSFDHLDDQAAAQVLSAFASEGALILAHQEIAEGDEVAAAQALIEQLGLRGVLFTADALHCQKN